MIAFDEREIGRRVPVWVALSSLFSGKELQDYDYRNIAETLQDSGYTTPQLETILYDEVTPVFHVNLGMLALPEMEGWSDDNVKELILEKLRTKPALAERILPKKWLLRQRLGHADGIVRDRWEVIKNRISTRSS